MVDEKDFDKTVEFMRLILLARLVEITGIVWMVWSERYKLNVKFECRFGFARHECKSYDLGFEKVQEHIENKMNDVAWGIAKAYWYHMGHKYVIEEKGE